MSFLFSYYFWFTSGAVPLLYVAALFFVSMVALVGAFVLRYFIKIKSTSKARRAFFVRLQNFCLTFGFLGVLWSVFYYEGAYVLSMKFWLIVIGVIALARLIFIGILYHKENIPVSVNMAEKLYRKYLPR